MQGKIALQISAFTAMIGWADVQMFLSLVATVVSIVAGVYAIIFYSKKIRGKIK